MENSNFAKLKARTPQNAIKPNISISSRETDSTVELLCWLDKFYPKEIKVMWYEGETLFNDEKHNFNIFNKGEKAFFARSQISINAKKWNEGTEFICEVEHQSKSVRQSWSKCKDTPTSKPIIRLEKPSLAATLADSEVTVSCVVESVFNAEVSWHNDRKPITGKVNAMRYEMTTVNNLTIPNSTWNNLKTITCEAKHQCFGTETKTLKIIESSPKTPTVEIRRVLADMPQEEESTVFECVARDLPSGELSVTLHANNSQISEAQYVDLPKGLDSLTTRFTVPKKDPAKAQHFTCQILQSPSTWWNSKSTGNLFDAPSVELSVVPSTNEPGSTAQKILCSATGFYPKITWSTKSSNQKSIERAVKADGRVKVSSEIAVLQQEWNKADTIACQVSDQGFSVQKDVNICAVTPVQEVHIYLSASSISAEIVVTCLLVGHKLNDFSITWKVGNINTSPEDIIQPPTDHKNGTQSVCSVLHVPAVKWNVYMTVSCEVKHFCAKTPEKRTISKTRGKWSPKDRPLITYSSSLFRNKEPKMGSTRPSDEDLSGIHNVTLLCLIEGFYPADISVHWELDGKQMSASRFTNSPVGNLSDSGDYSMHSALILPVLNREYGTFACVVIHDSLKNPKSTTINNMFASVNEHAPSVKLLQGQDELVCLAYGYSPSAINITWLLNNVATQRNSSSSSSARGPDGKFTIQSHLKMQALDWVPGDTYTCLVQHITGSVTQTVSKTETIYFDENKSVDTVLDQAEENWNMACAFIVLFIISLLYGCSVTLIKVKTV
ncbi:Ig mu chain C region membrane-bound form [Bagarius yarrelli]|uniref:Ig mu chain C region membrane-bound form n=1 Tax=Bagarius yarrelli TaxID=175774 RepID=A0A556TVG8_BAGYA|nr:Ig mu chain C region membrane-bound form [Bagarius yarrelli]